MALWYNVLIIEENLEMMKFFLLALLGVAVVSIPGAVGSIEAGQPFFAFAEEVIECEDNACRDSVAAHHGIGTEQASTE
jgi:hypothetical protein